METAERLIELLGEDNTKRIKDKVADFIIDSMKDDIDTYNKESYILDVEEIIDFINKCKDEAFERIKDEVVNQMIEKIRQVL